MFSSRAVCFSLIQVGRFTVGEFRLASTVALTAAAAHRLVTVIWPRRALRSARNPLRVGLLTGRLLSTTARCTRSTPSQVSWSSFLTSSSSVCVIRDMACRSTGGAMMDVTRATRTTIVYVVVLSTPRRKPVRAIGASQPGISGDAVFRKCDQYAFVLQRRRPLRSARDPLRRPAGRWPRTFEGKPLARSAARSGRSSRCSSCSGPRGATLRPTVEVIPQRGRGAPGKDAEPVGRDHPPKQPSRRSKACRKPGLVSRPMRCPAP